LNTYLQKQLDYQLNLWQVNSQKIPRIVIIGIGNEFHGDDAAGILVIRQMRKMISDFENIQIIEASVAPENFTGQIRKFSPDWVWIIDAAAMELNPGEIRILDSSQIDGVSALTHQMPLTLFVKYIQKVTCAEVIFFGIQPKIISSYVAVTPEIKTICKETGNFLTNWILTNIK
jgi:hydrogenase 3 maturation protease